MESLDAVVTALDNVDARLCVDAVLFCLELPQCRKRCSIIWSDCVVLLNCCSRSYCDDRAMQFCKPMLDSGTLGAKGNTQVVVPRKTVHWGAYRDPPAKSIALCTLKSFP